MTTTAPPSERPALRVELRQFVADMRSRRVTFGERQ